jgi:hypothetical protein
VSVLDATPYRPAAKAANNDFCFHPLALFDVKKHDMSEFLEHSLSGAISRSCFAQQMAAPHFVILAVIDMRLRQLVVIEFSFAEGTKPPAELLSRTFAQKCILKLLSMCELFDDG